MAKEQKRVTAQSLSYGFGVLTSRSMKPLKFLPPIIDYSSQTYDYITQVASVTRTEKLIHLPVF